MSDDSGRVCKSLDVLNKHQEMYCEIINVVKCKRCKRTGHNTNKCYATFDIYNNYL